MEQVYGLNMVIPSKKTNDDKIFETKVKRQIIKSKAEQLIKDIQTYHDDLKEKKKNIERY